MATTDFATSNVSGVNFNDVFTPPLAGSRNYGQQPAFSVGTQATGTDGSVWVYVVLTTGGTTGPGYVCVFDETFTAAMLSTSNDVFGKHVGVPQCAAAASGDYIWLQIAGVAPAVRVAALCAEDVPLSTTGTGGVLDDASGLIVDGIVITTTAVGASAQPGNLNFPTVTATAGP